MNANITFLRTERKTTASLSRQVGGKKTEEISQVYHLSQRVSSSKKKKKIYIYIIVIIY